MMRLEARLVFGHNRFPSQDELALGYVLYPAVCQKAMPFLLGSGCGTDHGSVYTDIEFLKRDYKSVMQIIVEVLREHSIEHLAKITEKQPLSSPKVAKPDYRRRSPLKNAAPPNYLLGKVRSSLRKGPARLLFSGMWCGHGRDTYKVFDILDGIETSFRIRLPKPDDQDLIPPVIMAVARGKAFPVYDSREHCGSIYSDKYRHLEPRLKRYFHCPKCDAQNFQLAVGFEVPSESEGPNDTSWYALAAGCDNCKWIGLIYDDETQ